MFKLSQIYISTISFAYWGVFSENINGKKILLWGRGRVSFPRTEGVFLPYTQIVYDITIVIINNCFGFQNDWHKMNRFRHKCTKFCPSYCVKELKNFEQHRFLSDMHQNLINTKLYQGAIEHTFLSNFVH